MHCYFSYIVEGLLRKQPNDPVKGRGQIGAGEKEAEETEEMWQEIKDWSQSIELIYQRQEEKPLLTRVYFQFDPKVGLSLPIVMITISNDSWVINVNN